MNAITISSASPTVSFAPVDGAGKKGIKDGIITPAELNAKLKSQGMNAIHQFREALGFPKCGDIKLVDLEQAAAQYLAKDTSLKNPSVVAMISEAGIVDSLVQIEFVIGENDGAKFDVLVAPSDSVSIYEVTDAGAVLLVTSPTGTRMVTVNIADETDQHVDASPNIMGTTLTIDLRRYQ